MSEDFTPRNYQVALLEVAKQSNTIIYLPTGSGKTFIAILLLKHLSASHLTSYSEGGKISFFVVNTVALVDQHARSIENRTTLKVGRYSGDMNLDFWPKTKWFNEFNKYNVFVMTVQILVNLTNQNFLDLNKVNLIVFDECHRAVNDQPMRQLCKSFQNLTSPPRVLGLTATLLNGNCSAHKVQTDVQALEITYNSRVATFPGISQVIGYSTNPKEEIISVEDYQLSDVDTTAIELIEAMLVNVKCVNDPKVIPINQSKPELRLLDRQSIKNKLENFINDIIYQLKSMGTFGGLLAIKATIIRLERLKRKSDEYVYYTVCSYMQTTLSFVQLILEESMRNYTEIERVFRFTSSKIHGLLECLEKYKSPDELCGIIFVKRRFTAKVIFYILDILRKVDPKFSHIKPDFIVGYNCNPYNNTRENMYNIKKNRKILQSFDNREINVLCSSNVLEEGVDVSTCSLVIKYDYPEEYRAYIQSKGRARNKTSIYTILIEKSCISKFLTRYKEFQTVEKVLHTLLIDEEERSLPSSKDLEALYSEDEIPPYYVDGPMSAKVDMVSAIPLLNNYCNQLVNDKYTTCTPEYYLKKIQRNDVLLLAVTIFLPTSSPLIDPIEGPCMTSIKSAKRAAALKACELLHKSGELDEHLNPKGDRIDDVDLSFLFKHYPKVNEPLAGIRNNKRLHKKVISKYLKGVIDSNESIQLHIIKLTPEFDRREELNQSTFYDMYTANLCYGLITPHAIPTISSFPIFVSHGTINVSLDVNVEKLILTKQDISDIREFNYNVTSNILKILRPFVVFDNGSDAESLLIVPIDKTLRTINFALLRQHIEIRDVRQITSEERLSLNVTQESYLRKIVSPWYREIGHYVVTEVALTKSAKSQFPNEEFTSYEEYYQQKHDVRLLNAQQPLLYVKAITQKKNFIKPLSVLQLKRKKEKDYGDFEIHLIPELVVKQDFPAELWIQASLLPTIVSRISYLLQLEEFRVNIAVETKMGNKLVANKKPLEVDIHLLNYKSEVNYSHCEDILEPDEDEVTLPVLPAINFNKDYCKRLLELEYPWKDIDEPIDIEKKLNSTILEIEYYENFISMPLIENEALLKNETLIKNRITHALTYDKNYIKKSIKLIRNGNSTDGCELSLLYRAMTVAAAQDIVNMERLETLGDSFLKYLATIYTYIKFPKYNEGKLTQVKSRLVSNKNLYYLGEKKNIGGIMKVHELHATDWLPPGFEIPKLIQEKVDSNEMSLSAIYRLNISSKEQLSGKLSKATQEKILRETSEDDISEDGLLNDIAPFFKCNYASDKTIADCVEALIGAHLISGGITGALKFVEWINIIPSSDNLFNLLKVECIYNPILALKSTVNDIQFHIPYWEEVEKSIGYHFNNLGYLLQALTHSSYTPNRITRSYEKLEFVGDAILDFLITCHIYELCDSMDPGDLTDLRSALVNNNTFASMAVRCNLHKYLLMINPKLQTLVDRFVQYSQSKNFEIDDEVLILLEETDDYGLSLAEYIDVPKVLGDVFEAIAGAIFLDSGNSLQTVWEVFHRIMWKEIEKFSAKVPQNLIRRLYEWTPNLHPVFGKPIEASSTRMLVPLAFMKDGRKQKVYGCGSNKEVAKRAAAKLALRQLIM